MSVTLPPLRPELRVLGGPEDWDGAPTATVHDPVRDRFFRIGWLERALLRHWRLGTPDKVAEAASAELGRAVAPDEVTRFAAFLAANELVPGAARPPARQGWLKTALHSYLFFRIPLCHLDRPAAWAQPYVAAALGARGLPWALLALAAWGIVGTARQLDVFFATLPPIATAGGLVLYGAMLVLSALVHEFGHAIAARRAGCRVGRMGIAFMVLVPTLYTDLSDSWSLPDRRRRLAIGLAGVAAEGLLALAALVLWPLVPEGALRSALVALATTALVTTLVLNLNPLMRFDGYYILSDLLNVPNLQARAFALWTWRLRRALFGIAAPPPETPPRRIQLAMEAWAWAAIPWRAAVYLGIALLVYHAVFKLAGLALFAVEIGWFLVRPCWQEMRAWWSLRGQMRRPALLRSGLLLAAMLIALVLPWGGSVELGAVLEAERHTRLFAPQPARLAEIHLAPGARVAEGDLLAVFDSPELTARMRANDVALAQARWQVDHLVTQGAELERLAVEREALAGLEAERAGLLDQAARLRLTAPFAAGVADMPPGLVPGRWLGSNEPLAVLVDDTACRVTAYADERDLGRLRPGAAARFHPDDAARPVIAATLNAIDGSAVGRLDDALFHADQGGTVAIRRDTGKPVPAAALFRLRLAAVPGAACVMRTRGQVVVEAGNESVLAALARRAAAALRAESGW